MLAGHCPWRFISVNRPGTVLFSFVLVLLCAGLHADPVAVEQKRVNIGGRMLTAHVVRVPLDKYQVKVGLALGRVGLTESLSGIAKRYDAVAAINGCFFDAYSGGAIKAPWHNLVTGGEVAHIGDTGTTLGFDAAGDYRMDRVKIRMRGQVGGSKNWLSAWHAYLVNHVGPAAVFNKYWAGAKTPPGGSQVVVVKNSVKRLGSGGQPIPSDGFVLTFSGGESGLAKRFEEDDKCSVQAVYEGAADPDFWARVTEAIGCGPRLVKAGKVCYDPVSEGFTSPKILSAAGARSAIGVTKDKSLLLVTCLATVRDLAYLMKGLGADDAMNLDGGASSGLWANGKLVITPARLISNAVVVVKR